MLKTTYKELNLSDLTSNFNSWWSFISDFVVQGWKQDYRASWSVEFELSPIEYSEASPDIHAMIYASVRVVVPGSRKRITVGTLPQVLGEIICRVVAGVQLGEWFRKDYLSDTRSTHSKSNFLFCGI